MKLSGIVQQVEEKLDELRYDVELRNKLKKEIAEREREQKRKKLLQHSEDNVAVNIERVKQGYYSSQVAKMIRLEDNMRNEERREDSKKKREDIAKVEEQVRASYMRPNIKLSSTKDSTLTHVAECDFVL